MSVIKKLMMTAAGGAELLAIEDVFSTYLWTSAGSTSIPIVNGIDLANEGGMVWVKSRTNTEYHVVTDTERGKTKGIFPNLTNAQDTDATAYMGSFNEDGFNTGTGAPSGGTAGQNYASWTFRKAPRFFDVVTYTGNGVSGRAISHNLGSTPAVVIIKSTSSSQNWVVRHETQISDFGSGAYFVLNSNASGANDSTVFSTTSPTSTNFYVGNNITTNSNGVTYVAYLFANNNNNGGFGPTGDQDIIKCGGYTGNGTSSGPVINLGWEPQWILLKASQSSTDWNLFDSMRELTANGFRWLKANSSVAESSFLNWLKINSTGFQPIDDSAQVNASGIKYYYIAIRRGPMRQPTSGTEVFHPYATTNSTNGADGYDVNTGFVVDTQFVGVRDYTQGFRVFDRLRGVSTTNSSATTARLLPSSTAAQTNEAVSTREWDNTGYDVPELYSYGAASKMSFLSFRRAPGFFDVVAYNGNGVAGHTVSHNLGVEPEIIIVKDYNNTRNWIVGLQFGASTFNYGLLNSTQYIAASGYGSTTEFFAQPTSTSFSLGTSSETNNSIGKYVAYLFASVSGVSKIGSYTGNGSSQTIDCGFTSGARFVLIKRANTSGDWYVWDTARGIVTGNDPHLSLNTTAAEVTTNDTIDPASSGFIVNQVSATNVNVSSASYVYLAIAKYYVMH